MPEFVAQPIQLPPFPTRAEIADALNEAMPDRAHPITERTVRGWQERGFIKPHRAMGRPVRFDASVIANFLNQKIQIIY